MAVSVLENRTPRLPTGATYFDALRKLLGLQKSLPEKGRVQESTSPTILHVTHWKAGSQWLHKILHACRPDLTIVPPADARQFMKMPLQAGKIYPTAYVTREEFDQLQLPPNSRRFVVIRDLRDTLVSGYFSLKYSHAVEGHGAVRKLRGMLEAIDGMEAGLIALSCGWLRENAKIQESWCDSGERVLRYEDLLVHDLDLLEPVLLDRCELPVAREHFRDCVRAMRFENLTGGRKRGTEDRGAHERNGIAGGWREHFTPRVKQVFKSLWGDVLIKTGYEKDMNW